MGSWDPYNNAPHKSTTHSVHSWLKRVPSCRVSLKTRKFRNWGWKSSNRRHRSRLLLRGLWSLSSRLSLTRAVWTNGPREKSISSSVQKWQSRIAIFRSHANSLRKGMVLTRFWDSLTMTWQRPWKGLIWSRLTYLSIHWAGGKTTLNSSYREWWTKSRNYRKTLLWRLLAELRSGLRRKTLALR